VQAPLAHAAKPVVAWCLRIFVDGQMSHFLSAIAVIVTAGAAVSPALGAELVPAGTLRATFIATNPVQAKADPKTGDVTGPAADLARELGRRLGVPVKITPANGVGGVLDSVKRGEADIGFLAYDPGRAKDVDYSQTYALAQNTYLVLEESPLRSIGEIDRKGTRIGVTEGDTADLVLTRTLKNAETKRNKGGDMDVALKMLASHEIDAYGTNRQRLSELASQNPGLRMLPDNFYGVEQSIVVRKGNAALLDVVQRFLDEARTSGLVAQAITRSGIVGLDVAPPRAEQVRAKPAD
jgi:polar amino acid transport system substrate-binding protein